MSLTVPQLKAKLEANPDLQIIDVRSEGEIRSGIIPGAKWLYLSGSAQDFMSKIRALPKEKTYCVYCLSGGRSEMVVSFMRENGFTDVDDLAGGISSWLLAGNQVEKSSTFSTL